MMLHFAYHDHTGLKPVCFASSEDSETGVDELGEWIFCLSRITLVTYLHSHQHGALNLVFIL